MESYGKVVDGSGWLGVKPLKPERPVIFKFPVSGHVCFDAGK